MRMNLNSFVVQIRMDLNLHVVNIKLRFTGNADYERVKIT